MPDQERTLAVVLAELRLIAWPSTADCERFEALKCEAITLNAAQQKRIRELETAIERVKAILAPRYEPGGIRFTDAHQGAMLLITDGDYKDWVCYKHPDGQYVTQRKVTADEKATLYNAAGFDLSVGVRKGSE